MNPQDPSLNLDPDAIAEGRFTHTPINISNKYIPAMKAGDTFSVHKGENPEDYDTGETTTNPDGSSKIAIDLGPFATHESTSQISNHEQIHSLLGNQAAPIPFTSLKPYLKWFGSGRAGTPGAEIPAYMGSYVQGQIKGISPSEADDYQEKLLSKLPKNKAEVYRKIINAQKANKKFYEGE